MDFLEKILGWFRTPESLYLDKREDRYRYARNPRSMGLGDLIEELNDEHNYESNHPGPFESPHSYWGRIEEVKALQQRRIAALKTELNRRGSVRDHIDGPELPDQSIYVSPWPRPKSKQIN